MNFCSTALRLSFIVGVSSPCSWLKSRDFSQEHGELTPTMKLKRKAVEQKFTDLFGRIYDEPGFALEP